LLHNLAAEDITYRARYAIELGQGVFRPVDLSDPEWGDFTDAVEGFQLEVIDMTCDIQEGLESIGEGLDAIADNLHLVGGGGGGCSSPGSPVSGCIVDLEDSELLPPDPITEGNPAEDDPPDGFETWEEYFAYKCQAAHFIWALERKHMVALRTFDLVTLSSAIVTPIIAGLAGIIPAALTPAGFVVLVTSIVAIGIVSAASWFFMDEMIEWWDDNKQEIVCALYESGTSVVAVNALGNALEDAIQAIVTWGALSPVADQIAALLGTGFSQLAGNGIVAPLFQAVASVAVPDADCDDCEPPAGMCGGTYTFDEDVEGFEAYYQATISHDDGFGYNEDGSVKHVNDSGVNEEGWSRWECEGGHEIGEGTGVSFRGYLQGSTGSQVRMKVWCTDDSYLDTDTNATQETWALHESNLAALEGKILQYIYVISNNGGTGDAATVWIDDMIIDP
jgi:hypothetical protein